MEDSAFIGRGWGFPPQFQAGGAAVRMVAGEVDIEESLMILFSTRYRERVLHHRFGADFESYIFANVDHQMLEGMRKMITDAVATYEPRILLERVDFMGEPEVDGVVHVELEFRIKSTNARHNIVFPFNLAEGSLYQQIIKE